MTKLTAAGLVAGNLATTGLNSAMGQTGTVLNNLLQNKKKQTFSIDGNDVVTQKKSYGKVKTNYNLSEDEKALLDYTNKNILNGLENINVFSDDIVKSINDQVDAYKNQGLRTLNETYTPMFRELKADIASRFGNLDNSIFMDELNEIEKNRTNALATLTENILAKQNELYETEMNNRYNYLNALSQTNENIYSKILNYLQLAN